MVDPRQLRTDAMFVSGNDQEAKDWVHHELLERWFGWEQVIDLGDITAARAQEMWLPLWLRLMGATGRRLQPANRGLTSLRPAEPPEPGLDYRPTRPPETPRRSGAEERAKLQRSAPRLVTVSVIEPLFRVLNTRAPSPRRRCTVSLVGWP